MNEQRFFRFLRERIGLDVESVGAPMVERALRQRCVAVGATDLEDYWLRLQQSTDEQQALIEAVIVPETWFFRYPESFTALGSLAHKRQAQLAGARPLRLLSLPCSTGEEPYSLAMALLDAAWRRAHSSLMAWTSAQLGSQGRAGCVWPQCFPWQRTGLSRTLFRCAGRRPPPA